MWWCVFSVVLRVLQDVFLFFFLNCFLGFKIKHDMIYQGKELMSRWCCIGINATSLTFRAKPPWTASLTKGQYAPIYWAVRYGKWGNPSSSCFLSVTSERIKLVALAGLGIVLLVNKRTWGMKQYSCTKRKNDQSPLKFTFSESPSSIILGLGYIFKLLYMCLHESYFMMALWVSPILMRAVKKNSAAQI